MPAGTACDWIPACAGMTTEVREEFSCLGSGAVCLSQPSFASRVPSIRGVQRGKAPLPGVRGCPSVPFFFSPKIGGQGVDRAPCNALCYWIPACAGMIRLRRT